MAHIVDLPIAQLLAAPAAPSVANQGTAGATAYSYRVVAVAADGTTTDAGPVGATATGNATLSGSNFNRLTWSAVPGAAQYQVRRETGGATQGKIGTTTNTTFDDTGLVGDGSSRPTVNLTGRGGAVTVSTLRDLCVQVKGTYVATLVLEGTLYGGTVEDDWATILSPLVGPGLTSFYPDFTLYAVRVRMSAWTSGAPTAKLAGHLEL